MRLLAEGEPIKINNFVEYLIENYNEKGETYEFKFQIEDRYDKKMLENREQTLKDRVLLLHADGFEILGPGIKTDYESFSLISKQLTDIDILEENIKADNLSEQFVNYQIIFDEMGEKHQFDFSFIDLSK